jgi:hypothetical protein
MKRLTILLALLALPTTAGALTQNTLIPKDCKNEAYKPSKIVIACGDGNLFMTKIKWSSWTSAKASGSGTINVNLCEPNCAKGTFKRYPGTITLSKRGACVPVGGGGGPAQFKHLSYTYTGSKPKGAKKTTTQSVPCPGS